MKTIIKMAAVFAILPVVATPASAGHVFHGDPAAGIAAANGSVIQVLNGVNGRNAEAVYTSTGSFYTDWNGNWTEQGNDGAVFHFRETGRDDWSVYLRDDSRGVNLQLDLHTKEVKYSDDNGQSFVLYQITGAQARSFGNDNNNNNQGQIGNAASSTVVEYSCNEGIPLVVVYENIGNDSWATWTHDGFKGTRMPQVVSGSGSQYSDGRNTLHSKGREVYLNLDGIEDYCTEN